MSAVPVSPLPQSIPPVRRPAPAPAPAPERPGRLHVVRPPARSRTRAPFVVTCMAVLVASLVGTLLLNTAMAQGEYERAALQSRLARSAQVQEALVVELEHKSSPEHIEQAARALGMVPSAGSGYLRLSDGVVLGDPVPARGPDG